MTTSATACVTERFTFTTGALRGMAVDHAGLLQAAAAGTLTATDILTALGHRVGTWWAPVAGSRTPWTDATEYALTSHGLPLVFHTAEMPDQQSPVNDWGYTQTAAGTPISLEAVFYSPGSGWVRLDARDLRATA